MVDRNDVYTGRCPFCGDSRDPEHTHLMVYLGSLGFYCFRCGIYGNISLKDAISILSLGRPSEDSILGPMELVARGTRRIRRFNAVTEEKPTWNVTLPEDARPSMVKPRWFENGWDIFGMSDRGDHLSGYHLRMTDPKKSYSIGTMGLGLPGRLVAGKIYHIVEGPYDVVRDDFICTYGIPTDDQVRMLRYMTVILVPDSDIWLSETLFLRWFKPWMNRSRDQVKEVWQLEGGDIDEDPTIRVLSTDAVAKRYYEIRKKRVLERGSSGSGKAK